MKVLKWLIMAIWLTTVSTCRLCLLIIKIVNRLRTWGGLGPGGALGSARFANRWELFWAGVFRGQGPIVGRVGSKFLRFNKDGMIAVFAPMGAGKGVGV